MSTWSVPTELLTQMHQLHQRCLESPSSQPSILPSQSGRWLNSSSSCHLISFLVCYGLFENTNNPLTSVVVGSPAFLVLTGIRAGPLHHWRYFQLQGLNKKERKAQIKSREWKYTWYVYISSGQSYNYWQYRFGTVALSLQLVPVASMFFLLTTAAGSALWVAHLEDQKKLREIEPVVDDEEPPAYTDTPPV